MRQLQILIMDELSEFVPFLRMFPEPTYRVIGPLQGEHDLVTAAIALTPDIVVLNIDMSRFNWIKAVRRLRALVPNCCVIVKSSWVEAKNMAEAYAAGVSVYLINGISPSLRDVIHTVIDHSEKGTKRHPVLFQEG